MSALGPRLVERAQPGTAGETEAARLLRLLPEPPPLDDRALLRIQQRISGARAARVPGLRGMRWWALLGLGVAGAAVAGTAVTRRYVLDPVEIEARAPRAKPAKRARAHVAGQVTAPTIEPLVRTPEPVAETSVQPAPGPERVIRPRPAPPRAPERPATRAQERSSALADESRLLEQALQRLRRDRDARGALARLDEYRQRFPAGQLAEEERRARVEALLGARRSAEALATLDGLALGRSVRDLELALLRGELRAEAGRCAEARGDFDRVLGERSQGGVAERALYGSAFCALKQGERAAARSALQAYARRFPEGRFRAEVGKALADLGP